MSRTKAITLLIADSNVESQSILRRALADQAPLVRAICADTGRSAIEQAKQTPPHAALADMRLHDMSGLKLLSRIKSLHPQVITMMMSDCGSHEARKICLEAGIDFFFEKPVEVERLIGMLGTSDGLEESVFRGSLQNLSVPDVLQLVCCRPSPMVLRVNGPAGDGFIEIQDGHVVHAGTSSATGEDAFCDIATWTDGHFEVVDTRNIENRSIALPLPQLLLSAAARSAEGPDGDSDGAETASRSIGTFFPPEELAPDASHVWGPMAHYARPQISSVSSRRAYVQDTSSGQIPTLRAFRYEAKDNPELRLRVQSQTPFRLRAAAAVQSAPVRPLGRPQRSYAPATRRIAIASFAASLMLFAGVRYSGVLTGQYGRNLAPMLDTMIGDFMPSSSKTASDVVQPSSAYTRERVERRAEITNLTVAPDDNVLPEGAIRTSREVAALAMAQLPSLSAEVANRPELLASANTIGVLSAVYERMGLQSSPWVEVISPHGKRVGALAIRVDDASAPVVLTDDLAASLADESGEVHHVKLRRINWSPGEASTLSFANAESLPGIHCEYWYSVGVSLQAMRAAGLAPGSTATVQGPSGLRQAVRVQLVDRGQPDEIWLSQPVRDSIGAADEDNDISIVLFPKT